MPKIAQQNFDNSLASKVCVSVYGRTASNLKSRISEARKYNPAFIELRLDYLEDPSDIFRISRELLGNEIFTFRSRAEGGMARVSEKHRAEILRMILSSSKPHYVDIEIASLESYPNLAEAAKQAGSRLISSSHDFQSIESPVKLRNLVRRTHRLHGPFAIKIVRKARSFEDNERILSLYSVSKAITPSRLIAFCAGPLGILSRISCVQLGSPYTYVSLPGEKTAPGQLEVSTMQGLLKKW